LHTTIARTLGARERESERESAAPGVAARCGAPRSVKVGNSDTVLGLEAVRASDFGARAKCASAASAAASAAWRSAGVSRVAMIAGGATGERFVRYP